jgi:hypothetical protein
MAEKGKFRVDVPLDASGIKDFKPERPVKVVAYDRHGKALSSSQAELDAKGHGHVTLTFDENPGAIQVILGPASASDEELRGLQTISVNVPSTRWREGTTVKLAPVVITGHYSWWWHWCREFTITGRVVCANGQPVVGATVCAYDVDWWWWWASQEQVGCAATDANGNFSLSFTRCCGWWPWWWWLTREWLLDPILADRISTFLKEDPKFARLPRPTPKPSMAVFQQLLQGAPGASHGRPGAALAPQGSPLALTSAIDANALDGMRKRLVEVLPRNFPIRIWPWYPWFPWWDCDADIIFKATQLCGGQVQTIVNETIFDTRWDIPNHLNVTLTSNEQACCAFSCDDPAQCPEGNCIVPTDICEINVGSVGGNVGDVSLPSQVGLFDPGVQDRPFAGTVDLFGVFGDSANVDYYEFEYSTAGQGGPYTPLPLAAAGGFSRQHLVILPGPIFTWQAIPFPVTQISDSVQNHNVIETIAHYEANHGAQVWDSITHDLLIAFNTLNTLPNGTYWLRLAGYRRPGYAGNLVDRQILPVCDPNVKDSKMDNWWAVTIDNQAPGNTDPSGQPCGLHICTDQPIAAILQLAIVHANGSTTVIQGCDNICIEPSDSLQIDFAAYDPDAFLQSYSLELLYGLDLSIDLLNAGGFTSWSLTASPLAAVWAPPPALVGVNYTVGPSYAAALGQGATSPVWNGGSMRLTVNASGAFPVTCAYLLQLNVYKRPIQNCDAINYEQNNVSFESFTIQVGCPQVGPQ